MPAAVQTSPKSHSSVLSNLKRCMTVYSDSPRHEGAARQRQYRVNQHARATIKKPTNSIAKRVSKGLKVLRRVQGQRPCPPEAKLQTPLTNQRFVKQSAQQKQERQFPHADAFDESKIRQTVRTAYKGQALQPAISILRFGAQQCGRIQQSAPLYMREALTNERK